jgi:hypothetical protein
MCFAFWIGKHVGSSSAPKATKRIGTLLRNGGLGSAFKDGEAVCFEFTSSRRIDLTGDAFNEGSMPSSNSAGNGEALTRLGLLREAAA